MLATFTVLNAFDSGTDSLRWAMEQANSTPGHDLIDFNIDGGGWHTISLASELPFVTESVTIDAATQPGYAGAPLIEVTGGTTVDVGFLIENHVGSTVRGFAINQFEFEAIWLIRGGGHAIEGNYIGTNSAGTSAAGNLGGIWVAGSSNNRIGTNGDGANDDREGNLISGNGSGGGVRLETFDIPSEHNVIAGNYIGTDTTGTAAVANEVGIIDRGVHTIIGTDGTDVAVATRNLISGNVRQGIVVGDRARIAGNYLGVDVTGSALLSNGFESIIAFSPGNVIGTNGDGVGDENEGNLIAGTAGAVVLQGESATDNVVAGNRIGVTADGMTSLGPQAIGGGMVWMSYKASNNRIGTNGDGTSDALERNIIVTTGGIAVRIGDGDPGSNGNIVAGNYIGTDVTGMTPLGGSVYVSGAASGNRFGTNGDGVRDDVERNVVASKLVLVGTGTTDNAVAGNYLGVAADGVTPLNGGVEIGDGTTFNRISGNVIAFSGGAGITVTGASTTGNSLLGNSIRANGGLGIDLQSDGPTANDPGDADAGANDLQNHPVLTSAAATGASVTIAGSLNSTPNSTFRVEYFANSQLDPSGYGEGETYLGFANVTTDGNGDGAFSVTLPVGVPVGHFVTATATNAAGSTSEFSLGEEVVTGVPPVVTVDVDLRAASLNIDQNGAISLVIFGSSQFDVTQVSTGSITFAGVAINLFNTSYLDDNHDGNLDLALQFKTSAALKAALTDLYADLLLEDYADDSQYASKQDALIVVDGVFGQLGQAFQGTASTNLFLAGKSLKTLLNSLGI